MKKKSILYLFFIKCTLFSISNSMEKSKEQEYLLKLGLSVDNAIVFLNPCKNIFIMFPDKDTCDDANEKIKQNMIQHAPQNAFFIIQDTIKQISSEHFKKTVYKDDNTYSIIEKFILNQQKKQFLTNLSNSLKEAKISYKNIEFRHETFDEFASKICQKKLEKIQIFLNELTSINKETIALKEYIKSQNIGIANKLYALLLNIDRFSDEIKNTLSQKESMIISVRILKVMYEKKNIPYTILCAKNNHCLDVLDAIFNQEYVPLFVQKELCYCDNHQNCDKMHLKGLFEKVEIERQKLLKHS